MFGRKEVPSFFWGVHKLNAFGKKRVLHAYMPAHPPHSLASCSGVTCSSSLLIYYISNSTLMSMFQGVFKHQWPYPMNQLKKKGSQTYWQQSTKQRKQRYAQIFFLALPVSMSGNQHCSGHLFSGFVILWWPRILRHWIPLSQYICEEKHLWI